MLPHSNYPNTIITQQIAYWTNIFYVSLTTSINIIQPIHEFTDGIDNQGIKLEDSFTTTTEGKLWSEKRGNSVE